MCYSCVNARLEEVMRHLVDSEEDPDDQKKLGLLNCHFVDVLVILSHGAKSFPVVSSAAILAEQLFQTMCNGDPEHVPMASSKDIREILAKLVKRMALTARLDPTSIPGFAEFTNVQLKAFAEKLDVPFPGFVRVADEAPAVVHTVASGADVPDQQVESVAQSES